MREPNPYNSVLVEVLDVNGAPPRWIPIVAIRGDGKLYVTGESHSDDENDALEGMGFKLTDGGEVEIGRTICVGGTMTGRWQPPLDPRRN